MVLIDSSGLGNIIFAMNAFTGDIFVTFFIIFVMLLAMLLAMRVPVFFALIILSPLIILSSFFSGSLLPLYAGGGLYLAIIIARMLMS